MPQSAMTLNQLAEVLGAEVIGDGDQPVGAIASIDQAREGEITFATDEKRLAQLAESNASAAIVPAGADVDPGGKVFLAVPEVMQAVGKLLAVLAGPEDTPSPGIHPTAVIDPTAKLGEDVAVGPHVSVGPGCRVGDRTVLRAGVRLGAKVALGQECLLDENVVIRRGCEIGDRVRMGPNCVVGSEGFGYVFADGVHHKIPHAGNVVIGNDVEFGACVCVDRAKWGSTRIEDGCKIDNLSQIAHAVQVGKACVFAAQAGVAGSAKIEPYVTFAGKVGIRDNITVGQGATLAACTCAAQDVEPGAVLFGTPAMDANERLKVHSASKRLPELVHKVRRLEAAVMKLQSRDG